MVSYEGMDKCLSRKCILRAVEFEKTAPHEHVREPLVPGSNCSSPDSKEGTVDLKRRHMSE